MISNQGYFSERKMWADLPVVDKKGKLVGLLDIQDLLRAGLA